MTRDLVEAKNATSVIVDIEREITNYYVQCDIISMHPEFDEPQSKRINIRHELFNAWLSTKGYLEWCNDSADYKGEHQQEVGEHGYLDFIRNEDKIVKIIHEYLFEIGRISMAFDKTQI